MKYFEIFINILGLHWLYWVPPSFESKNKIVYKISYYKLGLSNFHRRYILKSPYVHGKWTTVRAFVGEED